MKKKRDYPLPVVLLLCGVVFIIGGMLPPQEVEPGSELVCYVIGSVLILFSLIAHKTGWYS